MQECLHCCSRVYTEVLSLQGVRIENREVPLYTEVSLFQGVEFHCIQRCLHFRVLLNRGVPLYTEVSSFQGVGVPLYTEVSSLQQGVGIEEFHCIQRCPHFRGLE